MTPKDGPRDWDKELADIDKLMAAAPAPAQVPAKAGKPGPAAVQGERREARVGPSATGGRRERIASVVWFSLATLLGVGLAFLWPYDRRCGMGLYAYLGSIGAFALGSMWSIIWSWRTRSAAVHFLSIVLLAGSAFLGLREVLPRIGYAKHPATWECPSPPAAVR